MQTTMAGNIFKTIFVQVILRYKKYTSLHQAFDNNELTEVIFKMIEIGGKEMVMETDYYGYTTLERACLCNNENALVEIISKLLEVGGRELLMTKGRFYGDTALHAIARINQMFQWMWS